MGRFETPSYPPLEDVATWRSWIAERDAAVLAMVGDRASHVPVDAEEVDVDGVRVFVITPHDHPDDDTRAFLEVHGGAFIMGAARVAASWVCAPSG